MLQGVGKKNGILEIRDYVMVHISQGKHTTGLLSRYFEVGDGGHNLQTAVQRQGQDPQLALRQQTHSRQSSQKGSS